ncbi:hypothetical protein INT44_006114 [Umbelopsis vinacea]|uniref:Uncharacterized protein n=1 Tax=Umbelopsis vinacea TaxID=44442 RepID=A0A8H7PDF6_9FUNG|nr:hypothetical protein INT44_006114 [Umbelopsis vinacea]
MEFTDRLMLLKHLRKAHYLKLYSKPEVECDPLQQCIYCGQTWAKGQQQLNHYLKVHGVRMNQPLLHDELSSSTLDASLVKKLGLTSWLVELPLISWPDMKVVTKLGESSNFHDWFNDLLNTLNIIATSLIVSKQIRVYARHLRDYNNLHQSALEGYWLKAQQESSESCGSYDSMFSTPPGSDSLDINSKRKYHENYETPESVKRHILDMKITLKLKEIERGTAKLRGFGSICHIPTALNKLLIGEGGYCNESVTFEEEDIYGTMGNAQLEHRVDAVTTKYSSKFVLAIVQGQSTWALITHLDAFYQQDSSIDDCALPSNTAMDLEARALVLRKTEGLYSFKELVIQCGPLQLLAIGGYYGQVGANTKTAFLGSALSKQCQLSTEETYSIMLPFFQAKYVRTIRHLRSYTKSNASRCWSFGSEEFQRKEFVPCHPLFYDSHPKRVNCKRNTASVASLLLHSVAVCKFSRQDYIKVKKVFAKIPDVLSILEKYPEIPQTLTELKELLTRHDAKPSLLAILDFSVNLERQLANKEEIELIFMSKELSETALTLYKSYLAHSVKEVNKKALKSLAK